MPPRRAREISRRRGAPAHPFNGWSAACTALADLASEALLITDPSGRILEANAAARALLTAGSKGDLHDKPLCSFFPTRGLRQFRSHLRQISRSDQPHQWEAHIAPQSGAVREVFITASAVREPNGGGRGRAVTGICWAISDVTYRHRVRDVLRQSEQRFRAIFDNTFQFIGLLEPDGTVLEADQTALDFAGLRLADVVGRKFWETGWWNDLPESKTRLKQAIAKAAGGEFYRGELDHRSREGKVHSVDFSLKPVFDAAGRVVLLLPEGRDMTERRRIERELAASEEKFRLLVDRLEERVRKRTGALSRANVALSREVAQRKNAEQTLRDSETSLRSTAAQIRGILNTAVDAIITIGDRGHIDLFNAAAERLFGYRAAEVVGRNVSMLMPQPYAGEHDGYLENYLRTGVKKIIGIGREVVGLRKDGSVFPMELAVSEVRLGERRTFTGMVRDLTERKRLEKEVLDIAEREQRRIGQDLHDGVCQQLAGTNFLVRVLEQRLASSGRAEAADMGKITGLLGDAISQARGLARGLQPVEPRPEGLEVALRNLVGSIRDTFRIACRLRCPRPAPINDNSAATHLYRIAQEAVNNALRHGKARRIEISLRSAGEGVMLTVDDDGVGMSRARPRRRAGPDLRNRQAPRGGMGLRTMNHRAHLIGAILDIGESRLGGVRVVCKLSNRRG